jgi:osmotically-inducible protein OsmY
MRTRTAEQIRDDVVAALQNEPGVDVLNIDVTAHDGVIELRGELGSHSERLSAMTVSREAAAPATIRSALTVAHQGEDFRLTDGDVAVEVARAIVQSSIPPGTVTFEVHDHVVTLHGVVADAAERARIRHIVQSARGVDFIDNRLAVSASAHAD